eukprot:Skav234878  [mRNA]  locus=scaffold840:368346:368534:- [translate_table: standard]
MAEISEIPSSRARFAAHDTLRWKYPFAYETLKANTLQRDKEMDELVMGVIWMWVFDGWGGWC